SGSFVIFIVPIFLSDSKLLILSSICEDVSTICSLAEYVSPSVTVIEKIRKENAAISITVMK
ncbi:hypothetical protein KC622_03630, partial [Candidatus Dojkabacteria bacterium]|nr:hypothetical protein [Candidatus Dojkabacteria bacterium]